MRRLRIVRAAHHVAVEIVLEDLDVLALDPGGHRHAGIRVELVPVQAEELEPLAVEVEAIRPERGLAEPDLPGQDVTAETGEADRGLDLVQLRAVGRPQADRPQIGQAQLRGADPRGGDLDRRHLRGDLRGPVEQLDEQGSAGVGRHRRVEGALDVHASLRAEYVGGHGEQVGEERLRDHPEVDVTVDPAGLEEVDAVRAAPHANRRYRQAARIDDEPEQCLYALQVVDVTVDPAGLEEVDAVRAAPHANRRYRQAARIDDDREQVVPGRDPAGKFGGPGQVPAL